MVDQLSAEEMGAFVQEFLECDQDGDGHITEEEFQIYSIENGENPLTESQWQDLLKEVDVNDNGTIEFPEFLKMMAKMMKEVKAENEKEMRKAFRIFDEDGSGFISAAKLKHGMAKLGVEVADEEVDQMIREADIDLDGQVNYEEFARMMAD